MPLAVLSLRNHWRRNLAYPRSNKDFAAPYRSRLERKPAELPRELLGTPDLDLGTRNRAADPCVNMASEILTW